MTLNRSYFVYYRAKLVTGTVKVQKIEIKMLCHNLYRFGHHSILFIKVGVVSSDQNCKPKRNY